MATTTVESLAADTELSSRSNRSESYFQLVWRRFRKSKVSIIGGLIVVLLLALAIFAEFFAPYQLDKYDSKRSFIPPSRIHFFDKEGNFHLRPFTYNKVVTLNAKTFVPEWEEDDSKAYPIYFFIKSWEYELLGIIPTARHLFGVEEGGEFFLLGTDQFGSDLWSKSCEAGRISLSMSLFGTLISVVIGSLVGVFSGYYGGWTDNLTQRFVEFITAFPQLALWLSLVAVVPRTWDPLTINLQYWKILWDDAVVAPLFSARGRR